MMSVENRGVCLQLRPPTVLADGFNKESSEPVEWTDMTSAYGFVDITYKVAYGDMVSKITINRPKFHNAFRPITVNEMRRAMDLAQDDRQVLMISIGSFPLLVT